jgi:hypothetical protein
MGTMRIGLTSVYVDDQDQAERFYTEILGSRSRPALPTVPRSAGSA